MNDKSRRIGVDPMILELCEAVYAYIDGNEQKSVQRAARVAALHELLKELQNQEVDNWVVEELLRICQSEKHRGHPRAAQPLLDGEQADFQKLKWTIFAALPVGGRVTFGEPDTTDLSDPPTAGIKAFEYDGGRLEVSAIRKGLPFFLQIGMVPDKEG